MGFSPGRPRWGVGVLDPVHFITGWRSTPLLRNSRFFHFYSKLWFSQHPCIGVGMRGGGALGPWPPLFGQIVTIKLQLNFKKRMKDDIASPRQDRLKNAVKTFLGGFLKVVSKFH